MKKLLLLALFVCFGLSAQAQTWEVLTAANSGLPNDTISAMVTDKDGRLYVATLGGLTSYHNNTWQRITSDDPTFVDETVLSLSLAPDGETVYFSNFMGAGFIKNGVATMIEHEALPYGTFILSAHLDRTGTLWIGTFGEGLLEIQGSNVTAHVGPDSVLAYGVLKMAFSGDGRTFAMTHDNGIYIRENDNWIPISGMIQGAVDFQPTDISADAQGNIWVSTHSGLYRYNNGTWNRYEFMPGAPEANIFLSVSPSQDGRIWIGPMIMSFDGTNFQVDTKLITWLVEQEVFPFRLVAGANGVVYAQLESGGLLVYNSGDTGGTSVEETAGIEGIGISVRAGQLVLTTQSAKQLRVEIFTAAGERIYSADRRFAGEQALEFNTAGTASGVYLISVQEGRNRIMKKFLLQ